MTAFESKFRPPSHAKSRWGSHRRHWRHADGASAPPWWPADEPWPPADGARRWHRRRRRFMQRLAIVFALLLGLSALGASTLLSWLMGRYVTAPPPMVTWLVPITIVTVVIVPILIIGFVVTMQRVGAPLGDLVSAADGVAAGEYSARLTERGPRSLRLVVRSFNSMIAQLQSQDQQRRQLMADIAHELRTPLTVIQGRLEGMQDGVYPPDAARIGALLDDTRMLARLVDDLRTLANAEAGSLPLRKEPADLAILLHDAVASFAVQAREAQVALRIEEGSTSAGAGAELPLVEIDPLRIREVLTNLLANALRHTGSGGTITVSATLTGPSATGTSAAGSFAPTASAAGTGAGDRVEVTVRDTGSGIPPEELPRIFDRFYKGASSHGSGLGLTIARNLVLAHGGEIAAESTVGRGTMIRFTLPAGPAA
jgi:signal transduction histidine kinase